MSTTMTDFGVKVIDGDTHVSAWVRTHRRLDIAEGLIDLYRQHVVGTVFDIGANLGDHTISYARSADRVIALEVGDEAFECLCHNVGDVPNVQPVKMGAGRTGRYRFTALPNAGASFLLPDPLGAVECTTLDLLAVVYGLPNFVKLDIEGMEFDALAASPAILAGKVPMVLEINRGALARYGRTPDAVFELLKCHGYSWKVLQYDCTEQSDQFDILAT